MCGIAGIVDPAGSAAHLGPAVARMCATMHHRGPDEGACANLRGATVGMRRLAIFDPANGRQPLSSPDGRYTLVFNGAIYNHGKLRDELAASGWAFRTRCDTEVLLAAYCTWREKALARLRGMFAFAVWDETERSLFLARDPFGIKPLYYRHDAERLCFASELTALNASGLADAKIDPLSVADYLAWLTVPAPRTIYRDVFSLRPGECANFRAGRLTIRTDWSFGSIPGDITPAANRHEFSLELRARLEDTVRAHAIADVPVGVFLSGGLDSAIITGLMARATGGPLRTFSIDFEQQGFSEGSMSAATARHFGTEHRVRILSGAEVARDLPTLLGSLDHPSGDAINTYYASQAASAGGVKVALSGLGGDELFGGYPSFRQIPQIARWLPVWHAVPPFLRSQVLVRLRRGDSRSRKLADTLENAGGIPELAAMQRRVFSESERLALLAPDLRRSQISRSPLHPEFTALSSDLSAAGPFETLSAWELHTYMADVLLRDSDVMSMQHSLELRVPFVDRPLIEWLWRQPAAFKGDRHQLKAALSAATADLLPPGLAGQPKRASRCHLRFG
jgi:asparagine synthase (glutamine-hydrolysing)